MQTESRYGGVLCDLNLTGGLETAPVPSDSPFPPFTPSTTPHSGYPRIHCAPSLPNLNFSSKGLLEERLGLDVLAAFSLSPYLDCGCLFFFFLHRRGISDR